MTPDSAREDREFEARMDRVERDRIDPAWCPDCQAMVRPTRQDFGIGPWEMGSQRGWNHAWVIACPNCLSTKLEESQPEEDEA